MGSDDIGLLGRPAHMHPIPSFSPRIYYYTVDWTKKQLQPYTKYVVVLAKPALSSMSIAFAAGACMRV